jgi:AcrR family transcriptional regulator
MSIEPKGPARKPRADGQRNRERLMEAAKAMFADMGTDVGLDEIARRAGVGIGTLYRHFPTRDAIVEAVYRCEVEQLAGSATRLLGAIVAALLHTGFTRLAQEGTAVEPGRAAPAE